MRSRGRFWPSQPLLSAAHEHLVGQVKGNSQGRGGALGPCKPTLILSPAPEHIVLSGSESLTVCCPASRGMLAQYPWSQATLHTGRTDPEAKLRMGHTGTLLFHLHRGDCMGQFQSRDGRVQTGLMQEDRVGVKEGSRRGREAAHSGEESAQGCSGRQSLSLQHDSRKASACPVKHP